MGRIALHDLRKRFGATDVIRGVDLAIAEGEFVVFVGPSGSGKSTLLRLIAGLERPDAGSIEIDGWDVTALEPVDRRLAMVFQGYALYPHMSVRGNMAFALETAKRPHPEINARVAKAARILQLGHLLDRRPAQLSGGQRQRVAIGRAIVREPAAFLFDEPLSNLDAGLRAETRLEIARLHRDLGTTMVYVTHDQVEAMTLADRIVVLDGGRVRQAGSPQDLYERPADLFVAGFIGSPRMNLLPARGLNDGTTSVAGGRPLALGARQGVPVQAGIRPEHLRLTAPEDGVLAGIVRDVEYLGADASVFVDLGASVVTVRTAGARRARPGEAVSLAFAPETIHLFDAAGCRLN